MVVVLNVVVVEVLVLYVLVLLVELGSTSRTSSTCSASRTAVL